MLNTHFIRVFYPGGIVRICAFGIAVFAPIASLEADPVIDDNLITFSGSHWWQVENAWPDSGIVCDAAGGNRECILNSGAYKWVEFLDSGSISGLLTVEEPVNAGLLQMVVAEQNCLIEHWLGIEECGIDNCLVETRYDRSEQIEGTSDYISIPSDYFACRVDCPEGYRVVSAEAEGGIGFDGIFAVSSRVEHFQTRGIGTSSVELLQFDFPSHEIEAFVTATWIDARAVCANF